MAQVSVGHYFTCVYEGQLGISPCIYPAHTTTGRSEIALELGMIFVE